MGLRMPSLSEIRMRKASALAVSADGGFWFCGWTESDVRSGPKRGGAGRGGALWGSLALGEESQSAGDGVWLFGRLQFSVGAVFERRSTVPGDREWQMSFR
jgi:hypothetical protein